MKYKLIAAVSVDGVVGIGDEIPWRIPEDFKHYRETTMGNMLLVGATTFKTLPRKAHEGREFMILNSGDRFDLPQLPYYQFSELDTVFHLLENPKNDFDTIYVIGGSSIYYLMIDHCDEVVLTWVNKTFDDLKDAVMFPVDNLIANFTPNKADADAEWLTSKTGTEYKVVKYERIKNNSSGTTSKR